MTDAQVGIIADSIALTIRPFLAIWVFGVLGNLTIRIGEYREYKKALEAERQDARWMFEQEQRKGPNRY